MSGVQLHVAFQTRSTCEGLVTSGTNMLSLDIGTFLLISTFSIKIFPFVMYRIIADTYKAFLVVKIYLFDKITENNTMISKG